MTILLKHGLCTKRGLSLILLLGLSVSHVLCQQKGKQFELIRNGSFPVILVDSADAEVVRIAVDAFVGDAMLVAGTSPKVVHHDASTVAETAIIVGTLGKSALIDKLVAKKKLDASLISGKWETFMHTVVNNPVKGVKRALVIVGSDRRATAFGVFELSKRMGVSPWVWWADVVPEPKRELYIDGSLKIFGEPSVKYRGIFLNDEDWGLKPWAAKHMDPDIKDIGPNTYARIFELMLRLKANFLWPAMHDCTKAFYYYPENPKEADRYAIVVGSSHCEPILRNNVFEWSENYEHEYGVKPGEWRYDVNKEQIYAYWDDRAKQSANFESVYTIGMRGIHDGSMPGPKDAGAKIEILSGVIADQRHILQNRLGRGADQIPQIFCPYKEVLSLYQKGIDLPDDVTIVWADDNHGYIRQLSDEKEQKRSGRSGVYYHLSYWGAPHDYLWLSSISPSLISFEMTKAYQYGADRLWIFNVGDIKPAELETQFAMDLAWDVTAWKPDNAYGYARHWAAQTFGEALADDIARIKLEYYRLAQGAKPEHMGKVNFSDHEINIRLDKYRQLAHLTETVYGKVPERLWDAYFQLVYYPVFGAKYMNDKILYANMSVQQMTVGDPNCLVYANKARVAYDSIQILTKEYNYQISGGKWNGMMNAGPRNLDVFKMPAVATAEGLANIKKSNDPEIEQATVQIPASGYINSNCPDGYAIYKLKGLGVGDEGVAVYPFYGPSYAVEQIEAAPYVEYKLEAGYGGQLAIEVVALPTHRVHAGMGVRYAISVNGDEPQVFDLNTPEKSSQWNIDVLRGYHANTSKHIVNAETASVIRIYLLDPGLMIDRLNIY